MTGEGEQALVVLVVEDQARVREALEVLFEVHRIPVLTADGPEEALAALRREAVGVVVQDMNFSPGETGGEEGLDLFHRVREIDPEMPVLALTAWASVEMAVKLTREGAADYLAKPWDDEKLVLAVRNLLRMRELTLENRRLVEERRAAREELARRWDLVGLVYASDEMDEAVRLALNVARSEAPVLVSGPSGSGKEKIADLIQANSRRAGGPFVKVNVGAIPQELAEAELFGADAGAFTGAGSARVGRFEAADGGTLFLDEVDAMSPAIQVKLLRALESGEFQRLGSSRTRRTDVRLVSATNTDLEAEVEAGRFREDLYYRLHVVEVEVPALARRRADVLPLARHFLAELGGEAEEGARRLDAEAEAALLAHPWPGNVRELRNRIHRATVVAAGPVIGGADLDLSGGQERPSDVSELPATADERTRIERVLVEAEGVVAHAARALGISRQALYRRMDRLGIELERRPKG